ncbi:MOSC domain-containing protein [Shewanella intestini]|uniref:MOSC domain-containing protein n=1 Tax=Shewanella intestini TaxID=2017544 RepID=A0ABS5I5L2_9GAMM|nr:MOSC domain-containing protein [Shewanella sp. XMDDZSB0408]MBR9729319.1 MOSC domain-containing protein [Shewanella intestini]MRG37398.1 MOSC domain-containing protein [Shewanella sp. XMDDZSB0408]
MTQQLVSRLSGLYAGDQVGLYAGVESTIAHKHAVEQLVVQFTQIQGNREADSKHHGGGDRVIHHFPREHYGQYRRWDMISDGRDAPSMGENISTVGVSEHEVNIGDIIQFGEVIVQVTQPRAPCFKLNRQFGHPQFALTMQNTALCGWFYKVLSSGVIHQHDNMVLIARCSDISLAHAMEIYFSVEFDQQAYQQLLGCEGLASSWQTSLAHRLDTGIIEPWEMRLYGENVPPK